MVRNCTDLDKIIDIDQIDNGLFQYSPNENQSGSNFKSSIVDNGQWEKKIKLMKMINVIERRSKMVKMDFWLPCKVIHHESKKSINVQGANIRKINSMININVTGKSLK